MIDGLHKPMVCHCCGRHISGVYDIVRDRVIYRCLEDNFEAYFDYFGFAIVFDPRKVERSKEEAHWMDLIGGNY